MNVPDQASLSLYYQERATHPGHRWLVQVIGSLGFAFDGQTLHIRIIADHVPTVGRKPAKTLAQEATARNRRQAARRARRQLGRPGAASMATPWNVEP